MVVNGSEKLQKVANFFRCESCDYISSRKSSYMKHLSTDKHKNNENGSKMVVNGSEKLQKVAKYICNCGKTYKHDSGYYRHKKNCNADAELVNKNEITDKDLIMMLLKQNSELIMQNAEFTKNGTNNITNSNNNSNNKTFNLQFFLNETCKDAMNIMDFVDSIKLQLSDLETVGKIGYVEGISNIINKNLQALDINLRPVHCTDKKREVLYIKDENKWEKENESKSKIRKAIKHVAHKNSKLIPAFREKYPDCGKSVSKYSEQFNKIVIEAMGGAGDNDYEKEDKIIQNIAKNVTITKNIEEI